MNKNIASTIITDKVRVSSAIIHYDAIFGEYYQYETIVFSDDDRVKFDMKIHGSSHTGENGNLTEIAIKFHNKKSNELKYLLSHDKAQQG